MGSKLRGCRDGNPRLDAMVTIPHHPPSHIVVMVTAALVEGHA